MAPGQGVETPVLDEGCIVINFVSLNILYKDEQWRKKTTTCYPETLPLTLIKGTQMNFQTSNMILTECEWPSLVSWA